MKSKFFNVIGATLLMALGFTACSTAPSAQQQAAVQAQYQAQQAAGQGQPQQAPAPQAYQPDQPDPSLVDTANPVVSQQPVNPAAYAIQLSAFTCPVSPDANVIIPVLKGYYGTDGWGRPLNASHFPVDRNGYCVSAAPVDPLFIYSLAPSAYYTGYLGSRYGVAFVYSPGYHYAFGPSFHFYSGPVVHHVTVVQNYHPSTTVMVKKTVTETRTVVNNGQGTRLPGKGVAPAVQGQGGTRLPGKDTPAAAAPPASKGGFNFNKQAPPQAAAPVAAQPKGNGFNFNKQPAAQPAATPAKTGGGFNFGSKPAASAPASAPKSGGGFSFGGGASRTPSSSGGSKKR